MGRRFTEVHILDLRYGCIIWCMLIHARSIGTSRRLGKRRRRSRDWSRNAGYVSLPHASRLKCLWLCLIQSMLLTLEERREPGSGSGESVIKTISTRLAGGRRELSKELARVRSRCFYFSRVRGVVLMMRVGNCGHAGVPLDVTFLAPCRKCAGRACYLDGGGLYTYTGYLC